MILLIRRDQRRTITGRAVFQLDVRAELREEELAAIRDYDLGGTVLYTKDKLIEGTGSGLLGLASRIAFKAMNISVTASELARGKRIECKDILEMLAVEEQIRDAAVTFKAILYAAAYFGGEEAIEI